MPLSLLKREKLKKIFEKMSDFVFSFRYYMQRDKKNPLGRELIFFKEDKIMRRIKTFMAFLTAVTMTMSAMSVTAYADEKNDDISVVSEKSDGLYKYSELKAMSDSELMKVYYSIYESNGKLKATEPLVDILSPDMGRNCETLDEFCIMLAYMYLNSSQGGETALDLLMYTGSSKSPYIPGETEDAVAKLLDDDSEYLVYSPRGLELIGAFAANRCIIRYNRTFKLYSDNQFKDSALKEETFKEIKENKELHDFAVAYICAAQLGFKPENHTGLYGDEGDTLPPIEGEPLNIDDVAEILHNYLESNDLTAYLNINRNQCNEPDFREYILVTYFDEKTKEGVEKCAEENGLKAYIVKKEMTQADKLHTIWGKIRSYSSENKLRLRVLQKAYNDNNVGINVNYFLGHEEDRPKAEKFITDMGFDKIVTVGYELIGDPDADPSSVITDPDEICSLLKGFVKEKGLGCFVYTVDQSYFDMENIIENHILIDYHNGLEAERGGLKQIEEFMTKEHIDQSMVDIIIAESGGIPVSTPTLKGDADVNGEVSLSDVVCLSKYNLNSTSFPLKNETAMANSDMNSDGVVDGLDTSALIEDQLGKK